MRGCWGSAAQVQQETLVFWSYQSHGTSRKSSIGGVSRPEPRRQAVCCKGQILRRDPSRLEESRRL